MKAGKKKVLVWLIVIVLLGGGIWYATQAGWFENTGPTNLPTAEERERIRAVEESSSQKAIDAKAGVGVAPSGSLQLIQEVPEESNTEPSAESDAEAGEI